MFLKPTPLWKRLGALACGAVWLVVGSAFTYYSIKHGPFPSRRSSWICPAIAVAGFMLIISALLPHRPEDFLSETPDLHEEMRNRDYADPLE